MSRPSLQDQLFHLRDNMDKGVQSTGHGICLSNMHSWQGQKTFTNAEGRPVVAGWGCCLLHSLSDLCFTLADQTSAREQSMARTLVTFKGLYSTGCPNTKQACLGPAQKPARYQYLLEPMGNGPAPTCSLDFRRGSADGSKSSVSLGGGPRRVQGFVISCCILEHWSEPVKSYCCSAFAHA